MTLEELVAALNGFADRAVLVEAIKKTAQPIYQDIFNDGHKLATAQLNADKTKLQLEIDGLKTQIAAKDADLKKLKESNPEAAKIHETYQAEIDALKAQLADKDKQHLAERKKDITDMRLAELEAALVAQGVNPKFAKAMLKDDDVLSRIRVSDTLQVEILQPGKDIPFAGVEKPIEKLAETLKGTVDPIFINSKVVGGSGNPVSTPGASGGGNYFDQIRERQTKKQTPDGKSEDPQQTLNKRLGVG